jgi:hypothetical protein
VLSQPDSSTAAEMLTAQSVTAPKLLTVSL